MGYYAYASGEIAVKRDLTQDQILKLYENCVVPGTKLIMLRGQEYEIHTVDELVEVIAEGDEAFDEFNVDKRHSSPEVLNLVMYAGENYNEDDVKETLEILAPITIEGSVRYSGDGDDTFWAFDFEDGEYVEFCGEVVYECDYPKCSMSGCAFCSETGRCKASAVRTELRDNVTVKNNQVVQCGHYLHINSALGFARKVILNKEETKHA